MAKKVFDDIYMTYIANTIRSYGNPDNEDKTYKTSEMAGGISDAVNYTRVKAYESGRTSGYNTGYTEGLNEGNTQGYNAGYTEGLNEGNTQGYNAGYTEGETAGKQAEGLAYWKAITANGTRSNWNYAFAYSNYSDIEFPNPVVITGTPQRLFYVYGDTKSASASEAERLPRKEDIDMTGITGETATFAYIYAGNRNITVPDYGIPALDSYSAMYQTSTCIVTIELIRCHEATTFSSSMFAGCSNLIDVTFVGVIGTNLIMAACPLSAASLKNIITCLKDYAGTDSEYTYTLTLKSSAFSALEAEGATAEYNGTACTWRELIDNKKWNLTLS